MSYCLQTLAGTALKLLEAGYKNESLHLLQTFLRLGSLRKDPLPQESLVDIVMKAIQRNPGQRNYAQAAKRLLKDARLLAPFEGKFHAHSPMHGIYYTSEFPSLVKALHSSPIWRSIKPAPGYRSASYYVSKKTLGTDDMVLVAELQGKKEATVRLFMSPLGKVEAQGKEKREEEKKSKDPVDILEERFPGKGWGRVPILVDSSGERIVCSSKNPRFDSRGMEAFDMGGLGFPGLYGVHVGDSEDWLCELLQSQFCVGDAYIYEIYFNTWNKQHPDKPFVEIEDPHPTNKEAVGDSSIIFSEMSTIPASIIQLIKVIPEKEVIERCEDYAYIASADEKYEEINASVIRLPVYSSLVYLSRTKHRGVNTECDTAQDLIQDSKDGDRIAILEASSMLATHPGLRNFKGWVVPAPRSTAGRPSNMAIAKALVSLGVGTKAVDMVQRIKDIESSRKRRQQKGVGGGTSLEEHLESMGFVGRVVDQGLLLVDDIFTTGATLKAVAITLRKGGYKSPLSAATLGYYQPDSSKADTCPVHHMTFYV